MLLLCIQLQICSQVYWEISPSCAQVRLQHISISVRGWGTHNWAYRWRWASVVPEWHLLKSAGHRPENGNINASCGVHHYMACTESCLNSLCFHHASVFLPMWGLAGLIIHPTERMQLSTFMKFSGCLGAKSGLSWSELFSIIHMSIITHIFLVQPGKSVKTYLTCLLLIALIPGNAMIWFEVLPASGPLANRVHSNTHFFKRSTVQCLHVCIYQQYNFACLPCGMPSSEPWNWDLQHRRGKCRDEVQSHEVTKPFWAHCGIPLSDPAIC